MYQANSNIASVNEPHLTKDAHGYRLLASQFDPTAQFSKYLKSTQIFEPSPGTEGKLIELKRIQARPSGCGFLGAKAVSVFVKLVSLNNEQVRVIIDSGSDITLISEQLYSQLKPKPKKITGRRINLIQVTGSTHINGYVHLPVFFETDDGPVKLELEAYIVKGMSTPFIIGNDFADQFELSVLRSDGVTRLLLGRSLRSMTAENSTGAGNVDEHGQTFAVKVNHDSLSKLNRRKLHRHNKRRRKTARERRRVLAR
jgi:hypothetical protein